MIKLRYSSTLLISSILFVAAFIAGRTRLSNYFIKNKTDNHRAKKLSRNTDVNQYHFEYHYMRGKNDNFVGSISSLIEKEKLSLLSNHCFSEQKGMTICTALLLEGHIMISDLSEKGFLFVDILINKPLQIAFNDVKSIFFNVDNLLDITREEYRERKRLKNNLKNSTEGSQIRTESYYESLVHPGMLAHDKPEIVVMIGGDRATLLEVLKHKTVECVIILETQFSFDFDDSRVEIINENVIDWFANYDDLNFFPIDLIIFNDIAHVSEENLEYMIEEMSINGIMIMPLGKSSESFNVYEQTSSLLEEIGMEASHPYENLNQGFLIACRITECRINWFANPAIVEISIHNRIDLKLSYFDGAIMNSFQFPHKSLETAHCEANPTDFDCVVLSTYLARSNVPISSFDVRKSTVNVGGRGLFTEVDVSKGSLLGFEMGHKVIRFYPASYRLVLSIFDEFEDEYPEISSVYAYMDGYGWSIYFYGGEAYFVDGSILTYINHGCNSTYNSEDMSEEIFCSIYPCVVIEEMSVNKSILSNFSTYEENYDDSSPAYLRHSELYYTCFNTARQNIYAGDEILQNYLNYESTDKDILKEAKTLREICSGKEAGTVSRYESGIRSEFIF